MKSLGFKALSLMALLCATGTAKAEQKLAEFRGVGDASCQIQINGTKVSCRWNSALNAGYIEELLVAQQRVTIRGGFDAHSINLVSFEVYCGTQRLYQALAQGGHLYKNYTPSRAVMAGCGSRELNIVANFSAGTANLNLIRVADIIIVADDGLLETSVPASSLESDLRCSNGVKYGSRINVRPYTEQVAECLMRDMESYDTCDLNSASELVMVSKTKAVGRPYDVTNCTHH